MKNTRKNYWTKIAALIAVAIMAPTLTLAETPVVAAAAKYTPTVAANIGDFVLPTKQVDVAQAVPLGPVPANSVGGQNKIVTPKPATAANGDTEEVVVTAPSENGNESDNESGFPILAAIPIAIAVNAILGAIIFAGVPS